MTFVEADEYPGLTVRAMLAKENIKIAPLARDLGVSRCALTKVLDGKSAMSPEMALRLDRALGLTAEALMVQQVQHDLRRAKSAMTAELASLTRRPQGARSKRMTP